MPNAGGGRERTERRIGRNPWAVDLSEYRRVKGKKGAEVDASVSEWSQRPHSKYVCMRPYYVSIRPSTWFKAWTKTHTCCLMIIDSFGGKYGLLKNV